MRVIPLQFGGTAYFELLADHSEWGQYLAVGERMIIVLDGAAYQIDPNAVESNSAPPPSETQNPWEQFWKWLNSISR